MRFLARKCFVASFSFDEKHSRRAIDKSDFGPRQQPNGPMVMYVKKRGAFSSPFCELRSFLLLCADGRHEEVHMDKITSRVRKLCYGLNDEHIDPVAITMKVVAGLYQVSRFERPT